jgi:hypothetical protein
MAAAAMITVQRAIAEQKENSNSSSASYVHPIANDLHIITGHAMNREDKDGSVLQPTTCYEHAQAARN